jgi:hypothetical protein
MQAISGSVNFAVQMYSGVVRVYFDMDGAGQNSPPPMIKWMTCQTVPSFDLDMSTIYG